MIVKGAEPGGPAEAVGPPGRDVGCQQQRKGGGQDGSTPGCARPLQGSHRGGHLQLPAFAQAVEHTVYTVFHYTYALYAVNTFTTISLPSLKQ